MYRSPGSHCNAALAGAYAELVQMRQEVGGIVVHPVRAGSLGIGLLSGGYGSDELVRAGAYRVYHDPADLLAHLDELGIRP